MGNISGSVCKVYGSELQSGLTSVRDLHCSRLSCGSGERIEQRWRTVKLPFVKEKQEASCGRPLLSGWDETAGRKPYRKFELRILRQTPAYLIKLAEPLDPNKVSRLS